MYSSPLQNQSNPSPETVLNEYLKGADAPIDVPAERRPTSFAPPPDDVEVISFGSPEPKKKGGFFGKEKPQKPQKAEKAEEKPVNPPRPNEKAEKPKNQTRIDLKKVDQSKVLWASSCVSLAAFYLSNDILKDHLTGIVVGAIAVWAGCRITKKYAFGELTLVVLTGFFLASTIVSK